MAFCSVSEMRGQKSAHRPFRSTVGSVDGQTHEVRVVVAATNQFTTDMPQVASVAIGGGFGGFAPQ